jgi:hypothetical protein
MTFSAVVPLDGLAGYRFLQKTMPQQKALAASDPTNQRLTDAFRERIGTITTASQLVQDRELLEVALGAFGLSDDIDNKYFVRTILEEGTASATALARKLSDQRYTDFSAAFGFGDRTVPRTQLSTFADEILARFEDVSVEVAVGEEDETLRLALNAERTLPDIVDSDTKSKTKWLNIIGNDPLRVTFTTALGLPDSIAQLNLDRQVEIFEEKLQQQMGIAIDDLSTAEHRETLIERYLLRASIEQTDSYSSGSLALALLSG